MDERRAESHYQLELSAPGAAREFIVELASRWGIQELTDDLELIVSELVTNAVKHPDKAKGGQIIVRYHLDAHRLRVDVRDPSSQLPRQTRPLAETADGLDLGGRGLGIVEALATRWGVTPRVIGKSVWCELSTTAQCSQLHQLTP